MTAACPRLRPLEIFATEVDGRRVICLRDPSGLTDRVAFLPHIALQIVSACDGHRTPAEVAAYVSAKLSAHGTTHGPSIDAAQVRELVAQLDDGLFLDSPRFQAHFGQLLADFRATPVRDAAHAGLSYAEEAGELASFLDAQLAGARARLPGRGERLTGALPAGLVAPHIDFARGGPVYGDAYLPLVGAADAYDLVIVFGTDHNGVRQPFTLTRKSYATPFGVVDTDVELVEQLAELARQRGDQPFDEELHHRQEHSIEFQAVWLRHLYGERTPPILPVLCGPLARAGARGGRGATAASLVAPRVRAWLETLRELTASRRVLVIAGADLAHVGPRFGDGPFRARERAEVERADQLSLACVAAGDADGFYEAIARDGDRFKVCGTSPIFATLALLGAPRRGELLSYAHCPADEVPESWVSIAALALY